MECLIVPQVFPTMLLRSLNGKYGPRCQTILLFFLTSSPETVIDVPVAIYIHLVVPSQEEALLTQNLQARWALLELYQPVYKTRRSYGASALGSHVSASQFLHRNVGYARAACGSPQIVEACEYFLHDTSGCSNINIMISGRIEC